MILNDEDNPLSKNLHQLKEWFTEDTDNFWTKTRRKGLDTLLKRIQEIGRHETRSLKQARTEDSMTTVNELVGLPREQGQLQDKLFNTPDFQRETDLAQSSVVRSITAMLYWSVSCLPQRLFPIIVSFSFISIAQGSVATQLRCGGIFLLQIFHRVHK